MWSTWCMRESVLAHSMLGAGMPPSSQIRPAIGTIVTGCSRVVCRHIDKTSVMLKLPSIRIATLLACCS